MININLLGDYIFKRIQKDNISHGNRMNHPREMMTGLYIGSSDIQRYIEDYFNYGIDHTGNDECGSFSMLLKDFGKPFADPGNHLR